MSDFKEIAVRNRQNGVSGEQTGRDLFALSPNGPLEDVVEALAFAGFPPRDTIMGATQYSTSLYPGESEYTHRQVIIDKMKAVGYPANEVDDAVADIWRGSALSFEKGVNGVPRDTIAEQVEAEGFETTERKESTMLGTWEIAKMKKSSLPEKVASGFSEATKNLKGAKYRPVLYCGKQIVAGTNHMIICKQTLSDREGTEHVVAMMLHQPLPKQGKKWEIVSITPIV